MSQFLKSKRLKYRLFEVVFSFARSTFGGFIVRKAFAYASWTIPVRRIRETSYLIAFSHPKPSFDIHILLVPINGLTRIEDMSNLGLGFLQDLIETVQTLVEMFDLENTGYSMIINGGNYQDVSIVHFQLVSNH